GGSAEVVGSVGGGDNSRPIDLTGVAGYAGAMKLIRVADVGADVAEAEGAGPSVRAGSLVSGHGGGFVDAPAQRNSDPTRRMSDKSMATLLGKAAAGGTRLAEAGDFLRDEYVNDRHILEADAKKIGDALRRQAPQPPTEQSASPLRMT
ncbi:MAG: hypothetical protein MJ061_04025, partial [Mailhella sp.]|nr:hypothetical protein [Mailhella sp.]